MMKKKQSPATGMDMSRRSYLKASVIGTAGAFFPSTILPARVLGRGSVAPSDTINIGQIGCGRIARDHDMPLTMQNAGVRMIAVCDLDTLRAAEGKQLVGEFHASANTSPPDVRVYHDYRELIAQPDIDAVVISTPDHHHFLPALEAALAGKDIYLQKPMTLYPDESLAVRNAVRRHQRICQVGTQIHAGENFRRVVEYIRSGKLGNVSAVRTFNVMNQGVSGLGKPRRSAPPKGLDWNRWVGPAPMCRFNEFIVANAGQNCSFMDFSGGWTPGMAPHIIDLPHWALDLDFPLVTSCSGGRFTIRDVGDVPDTQEVLWQYPGRTMAWSMSMVNSFGFDFGRGSVGRRLGIYFHGVNGTLFANYATHGIVPEGGRLKDAKPPEPSIKPSKGHEREWLDCIKSREQPSCNADYHAKIDVAIGLANISYRLQRSVRFDPEGEKITGDVEAARLARPEYRDPWKFPVSYLSS